ncbi:hypothetical protein C3O69_05776 [Pseudomonas aeruginosa]|nr:hypothetical protein C3O69_05776 [Pseudomonas aeruginosa]
MVRGIGGVAGDFLGGGAEFVDRRGDAVGAVGLLVGVGHRGVRGVHHQLRHVVQLASGAGDLADRFVDTLDEAVEVNGQGPELIVAGDLQALGQVAFALGDVLHGAAHVGERLHQYADQHAEEEDDGDHRDQRGDDRRGTQLGEHGIGLVLVHRDADVPVQAGQALDRRETEDPGVAVQLGLAEAAADLRRVAWVDVAEALHDLVLVRMDEDLAVAADQEGVAHAAEVQRVDDLHHRLQAEVAADHAERLAVLARRAGDGQYQLVDGRLHVGFGEGGLAGAGGGVVPGAAARVVVGRQVAGGARGVGAVGLPQVGEEEGRAQQRLFQQGLGGLRAVVAGQGLGQVLDQQDAPAQPVLHVAGGDLAHFVQVVLQVLADRGALQGVVVEGEEGEGRDHHQRGGEQDLVTELETFDHGFLHPGGAGALS